MRYDGPILAGHRMDVADLAPALIGISELCKIANRKFNGDKAAVKVLIDTDVEHQCFQIDLHVVQSVWDQTKALLNSENVGSAKELLEWLGLIGGPVMGVMALLKLLAGRKVSNVEVVNRDGRDVVQIRIEGDNNVVHVHKEAYQLVLEEAVLVNAKKVVQPVLQDGYEKVEFESPGSKTLIARDDAAAIMATATTDIKAASLDASQVFEAWVTVHSPVYDAKAPKWRFKFGQNHEYMDISETDIAARAILRGGALMDDAYRVRLELTQEHTPNGDIKNSYKIKEVLDFRPASLPTQTDAFSAGPHRGEDS